MVISRRKTVTIKHVAAEAGVSFQTVSRVVNNGPNVSAKAARKVSAAIEKLGWVPSIAAQRLGGSKSYLILALNDRERTLESWRRGDGSDWVNQMLLGGITTCDQHGYRMIFELINTHSDHVDREILSVLASLRPDGVILTPPHSDNQVILDLLAREQIPFARIGATTDDVGFCVRIDEAAAAAAATDHLLGLGHSRIGFICGDDDYHISALRAQGFKDTMQVAGLFDEALMQPGDFRFETGNEAAKKLLSLGPRVTAIIASSDQMALGALAAAEELGFQVPKAISIVSFDDTPIVRFTSPPLSAISHPTAALTAAAAQFLVTKNVRSTDAKNEVIVLPFQFNKRQSTGPCLG